MAEAKTERNERGNNTAIACNITTALETTWDREQSTHRSDLECRCRQGRPFVLGVEVLLQEKAN